MANFQASKEQIRTRTLHAAIIQLCCAIPTAFCAILSVVVGVGVGVGVVGVVVVVVVVVVVLDLVLVLVLVLVVVAQ